MSSNVVRKSYHMERLAYPRKEGEGTKGGASLGII